MQANVKVRISNLNTQVTTYWHTIIVNPQYQIVNQQIDNDTLLHYYSKDVSLNLYNINSAGCQHPGYGGCPPDNVAFNIEVIEGHQYGSIKNGLTGDISTSFTSIPFSELYVFTYRADGVQPDSTATVRIRHSSNDEDITPVELSFIVKRNTIPPPSEGGSIYVKMDREVVFPGDTVNVELLYVDVSGDTVEFFFMQRFNVELAEGYGYGTILNIQSGDTSDTFTDIGNKFKVIVEKQISAEEGKIIIVAQADLMIWSRPVSINKKDLENENQHSTGIVDDGGGITPDIIIIGDHIVGVGEIRIVKDNPIEILLGETKYFQTKRNTSTGKLKIEEITPDASGVPQQKTGTENGWEWITSDAWGDNPVSVVECDTCGEKMGVYWEKKYPTNNFEKVKIGKKDYNIIKMENLGVGLIRLVGRYWSADSTYIIRLKAKNGSDSTGIKVRVIKPGKLGNSGNNSRDVFNKPISIDSICITNGGMFGIPPQIIKGHIANEAVGFWPSYAYEPYTTEFNYRDANNGYKISDKWLNHPFLVDSISMGSGASIPNHFNVKYYNYIGTPTKVWEIVKKYSTLFDNSPPGGVTKYCKRASNDSLDFSRYGYSTVQSIYNNILSYFQGKKSSADSSDFKNARDSMSTYLKDYWRGGLNNHWAQTRLASSYGHLQLLLNTSIEEGYPDSSTKPPEDLNINSIHWPLAMKRLSRFLNEKGLEDAPSKESKWTYGYEATFQRMIIGWNPRTVYSNEVLKNAKSYLPQK